MHFATHIGHRASIPMYEERSMDHSPPLVNTFPCVAQYVQKGLHRTTVQSATTCLAFLAVQSNCYTPTMKLASSILRKFRFKFAPE